MKRVRAKYKPTSAAIDRSLRSYPDLANLLVRMNNFRLALSISRDSEIDVQNES